MVCRLFTFVLTLCHHRDQTISQRTIRYAPRTSNGANLRCTPFWDSRCTFPIYIRLGTGLSLNQDFPC
nr:MAG TPA: hypothetical protein [Caudoviricetes sp.]